MPIRAGTLQVCTRHIWLSGITQVLPKLLQGQETRIWGDAPYNGQCDVIQQYAPGARSVIQVKAYRNRPLSAAARAKERTKSKVRAKVEHAFLAIKRLFGWAKVRYRGLAKNTIWLFVSCGLTNLYRARRHLLAVAARVCVYIVPRTARWWADLSADALRRAYSDIAWPR